MNNENEASTSTGGSIKSAGKSVPQPYRVDVECLHALQEKRKAERAASDFVGKHFGVFADPDAFERTSQILVAHVFEYKLGPEDASRILLPFSQSGHAPKFFNRNSSNLRNWHSF